MAFVQLDNISLAFGDRDVVKEINFMISTGSRIALSGANGSGKSTLLKIISKEIEIDRGNVLVSKGAKIAYLPQSGIEYRGSTLREEAEKAFLWVDEILTEIESLGRELEVNGVGEKAEKNLLRHDELQELVLKSGYYNREEDIGRILKGLGFSEKDLYRPCSEFSLGWQMRIALAKELLKVPEILLLDEPTNYLDLEARDWLKDFLSLFKGGILIVSHDRFFLDSVVREVAELFLGNLKIYKGNYSSYEKKRREELENLLELYKKQQEEIAKLEAFINRFRYNASKASMVQSRVKTLAKLKRIVIPHNLKKIHFHFPAPPHSGKKMVSLENLGKRYGDHHVLRGIDHLIVKGDKLVISGRNGAGKSTLLRLLAGRDPDYDGAISYGTDVKIAYFSQDQNDMNDNSKSVLEEIESEAPTHLIPQLRAMLGAFLFSGDDIFKSVAILSGGEKNRLTLLKLLLKPANLLILDEPTNHLDIHSKDILLQAMKSYSGTIIFVSHDRYFIEQLAESVLELSPKGHKFYRGNYEYYLWKKENEASEKPLKSALPRKREVKEGKASREEEKKQKAKLRRLKREEESLLTKMEELEGELKELTQLLSSPAVYSDRIKAKEISSKIKKNREELEEMGAKWEGVEEKLSQIS